MPGLVAEAVNPLSIRVTTEKLGVSVQCHFWRMVGDTLEVFEVEHGRLSRVGVYEKVIAVHEQYG